MPNSGMICPPVVAAGAGLLYHREIGISSFMPFLPTYNGLFLWQVDDPDANRQGTGLGYNPGNLAGGDGRIFVAAGSRCRELDAATGRELAVHRLPPTVDPKTFAWQYLAYLRGTLVGTAVQRREMVDKARRRGLPPAGTWSKICSSTFGSIRPWR